jgi:putative CocE/NonD family hydrolase
MVERRSWIPMEDGVRLAASLYLPEAVEGGEAAPVVLEALPYRKDDVTASDRPEYERLCHEYGYAVARVDLRGTGSSEGVATDEYPASEQADLCRVIDWLASKPWSTGAVGMYGTSYSGFNSLQVAAERPPALKAVVAIYASDDRYTDDVHYTGGALKLLDLVDYPLYMVAMNALPPVPAIAGPRWRERWRGRVEDLEPWLLRWLEEQADGPYWRQGSLRPAYERIGCPTMLVAGWADGYRNATFRVMERLQVPSRLLFGPWSHMAADSSRPGPRIDLVPEMVRWWDRWLRGHRNGVDEGPPVTVYVRHSTRPAPDLDEQPGAWRDEPAWPPDRAATHTLPLAAAAPAGGGTDRLEVRADVGSAAWISCAGHLPFGQPDDQREDDAWSLTYDWGLEGELELLGHPRLVVRVGASAPVAFLSAKLCDVLPRRDLDPGGAGIPQPDPAAVADRTGADAARRRRGGRAGARRDLVGVPGRAPAAAVAGRSGLAEPGPPAGAGDPDRGTRRLGAHPARPPRPQPEPAPLASPASAASPGRRGARPPRPTARGCLAGGPGRAGAAGRGRDRPRRPDRAARRGRAGRALPRDGRDDAGPGVDLGPRRGRLPRRVAGGDRRHQRPAGPAWRRRRLRGPAGP